MGRVIQLASSQAFRDCELVRDVDGVLLRAFDKAGVELNGKPVAVVGCCCRGRPRTPSGFHTATLRIWSARTRARLGSLRSTMR